MSESLETRLDRLEAIHAIRQLAYGYAFAIDARDLTALVNLYVDDVRVGPLRGREALKRSFDKALRQFTTSAHHVTNHLIELRSADDALGLVACRIEHEVGSTWVTASLVYQDRYVRRNGAWLFRGRVQARLYVTGHDDPPTGPAKVRWPGAAPREGDFYQAFPAWSEFWNGESGPTLEAEGAAGLVGRLRRRDALPSPPRYLFAGPDAEAPGD